MMLPHHGLAPNSGVMSPGTRPQKGYPYQVSDSDCPVATGKDTMSEPHAA